MAATLKKKISVLLLTDRKRSKNSVENERGLNSMLELPTSTEIIAPERFKTEFRDRDKSCCRMPRVKVLSNQFHVMISDDAVYRRTTALTMLWFILLNIHNSAGL